MLNLMKLENRIVLDGAMVAGALEHVYAHESAVSRESFVPDHADHKDQIAGAAALLADNTVGDVQADPIEVILIADTLPDYQSLAEAAKPGTHVIVYGPDESAAEVIAKVAELSRELNRPIESLSLLSHGKEGAFSLGNEEITADNIEENADTWAELDSVLADKGQIYLFGCNVASGEGKSLLNRLAQVTGAEVFGSSDSTGKGGDWDLEVKSESSHTADPPLDPEKLAAYEGTLIPPSIEGLPRDSVKQGELYSFTPKATDPENEIREFNISNMPKWAAFDRNTGKLSGIPTNDQVGEYTGIKIGVTDQEGETTWLPDFSIKVINVNDAPEISGKAVLSVQEGNTYSFTPTAQDPDMIKGVDPNEKLTFSIDNKPTWASFDTATGKLYGNPARSDVGIYRAVKITVTDMSGATAVLKAFDIAVEEKNTPPVISGTPAAQVKQGEAYSFKPSATDAEDKADALKFSISNQPQWATFNPNTGELTGTPGNDDVKTYDNVKITVTDSKGLSDSMEFDLTVVNVNDAPTISGTSMNNIQAGTYYSFIPTSSDKDFRVDTTERLTFSIQNKPAWASFNPNTGELNGTPADVGEYKDIKITVTDKGGLAADMVFALNVVPTNDGPVISGTPPVKVDQDSPYYFKPSASDKEDDVSELKFSISKQPKWATFDPETGELSGTPGNEEVGIYSGIVITVTDTTGKAASLSEFSIEVVNVNDRPTISGTSVGDIQEGTLYSFVPTSGDKDLLVDLKEKLTFSIQNKPSWAAFNPETGELSGTPARTDVGDYNGIEITVTDVGGLSKSMNFNMKVVPVNEAPVIEGTPPPTVKQDAEYYFKPAASDRDVGDTLIFSISNQPAWATFNKNTGELTGKPVNADVGVTEKILITVTDNTGLSASLSEFSIEVVNVNDAPFIVGASTQTVQENTKYSFVPTSNDIDLLVDSTERLTYKIDNKPPWAEFNPNTGELYGTPTRNDVKEYQGIVITVTDAGGLNASLKFNLNVTRANTEPVIGGDPALQVKQGDTYTFTPTASDKEDPVSALEFSISNQPAWMTFSKDTGQLTGVPKNEDVGLYSNIEITVTDTDGLSNTMSFDVNVLNINDAPKIISEAVTLVRLGNDYAFDPTGFDPDLQSGYNLPIINPSENLTYSIENMPKWAHFDAETGRLYGVPTDKRSIAEGGDVGVWENVTITVTDAGIAGPSGKRQAGDTPNPLSASLTFPITVIYVNIPPTIVNQYFEIEEKTPGGSPVGPVEAQDADGYIADYEKTGGSGLFDVNPETGIITVGKDVTVKPGTYTIDVTVKDNDGAPAQGVMTIVVRPTHPSINLDDNNDGGDGDGGKPGEAPNFAATFVEGDNPVHVTDIDAIVKDPDSGRIASLTATVDKSCIEPQDVLAAITDGTNIRAEYKDGVLTLSGVDTQENYSKVLQSVTFYNSSQSPTECPRIITFVAYDEQGNDSNIATSAVKVIPLNDPPENHVPGEQVTPVDTPIMFRPDTGNGISVDDPDARPYPITTTLTVDMGTIALPGQSDSSSVVLNGTIEEINAALNGLTYTPPPGWTGTANLTVVTNDEGHTGYDEATYRNTGQLVAVPLTDTDTIPIVVGIPHPHRPETPPGTPPGPGWGGITPDLGNQRGIALGFLYNPGDVQPTGRRHEFAALRGKGDPCDFPLYPCCTLEETLRIGCRFAPGLDPDSRLCNVTWKWMQDELGWMPPYLDEEFDLYSPTVTEPHFLREGGDKGFNMGGQEFAWSFFSGRSKDLDKRLLIDEKNFVQGSEGEFNVKGGELKYAYYSGRENLNVPAAWGSTAWPLLGTVIPCQDGVAGAEPAAAPVVPANSGFREYGTDQPVSGTSLRSGSLTEENLAAPPSDSGRTGSPQSVTPQSSQGTPDASLRSSPMNSDSGGEPLNKYRDMGPLPEQKESISSGNNRSDASNPALDEVLMSLGEAKKE